MKQNKDYPISDHVTGAVYEGLSLEERFTKIYATEAWGGGSGAGSLPVHCLKWIEFVRRFIREEQVKSVVDLGCGDWQFSPYIYHDLQVDYVGYDAVRPVVEENRKNWADQGYSFEQLEFSERVEDVRDAELYILKDVLQHWSSARIVHFLKQLLSCKTKLRHVLICNCAEPEDWPETDICDGGWRPLTAAKSPLVEFSPEVLLRFQSNPNMKEVCLLRVPSILADSGREANASGSGYVVDEPPSAARICTGTSATFGDPDPLRAPATGDPDGSATC
eukprot:TRINITY_DN6299_c0_g1_i5.p1 TRINITY_DN6299_c0_g1~~TRINITY_DN6299_c0_g1_i5.p1  ORF type:complete len:277 (+),score=29.03 TRINITY_DN6299_c0_g1_i5:75-905(+)